MRGIVCQDVASARVLRAALDKLHGYPAVPSEGSQTWTASAADIIESASGGTVALCPVSDADAAAIGAVPSDVPPIVAGVRYFLRVDEVRAGVPIVTEHVEKFSVTGPIDAAKADAAATIRDRVALYRQHGFVHTDGHRYSLEHDALRQVMEAYVLSTRPEMKYPLVWPSIDRTGYVVMQTADDVATFALACSLADRALTERMAAIEMQVAAATTVDKISAALAAL